MDYQLTWLATGIVVLAAIILGSLAALVFRSGPIRTVWAILVALLFVAAGCCAIIFGYSWMFSSTWKMAAQAATILIGMTGVIYAFRAPS